MSRRAPPDPSEFLEFKGRAPRWVTPPGVILRRLPPGEVNHEPVLVCLGCSRPTVHYTKPIRLAVCRTCNMERRW